MPVAPDAGARSPNGHKGWGRTTSEVARILLDVCLTEPGCLRRRLCGRVRISFSIAQFSECDQLG